MDGILAPHERSDIQPETHRYSNSKHVRKRVRRSRLISTEPIMRPNEHWNSTYLLPVQCDHQYCSAPPVQDHYGVSAQHHSQYSAGTRWFMHQCTINTLPVQYIMCPLQGARSAGAMSVLDSINIVPGPVQY